MRKTTTITISVVLSLTVFILGISLARSSGAAALAVQAETAYGNDTTGQLVGSNEPALALITDAHNKVIALSTYTTTRVSVSSGGTQGNSSSLAAAFSADGRYVTFYSDASNLVVGDTDGTWDVFVHDQQTDQTSLVSVSSEGNQGNAQSALGALSGNGRYVTFQSDASNLVPGDTNGFRDIFLHDRVTNQTSRVSLRTNGTQGNGTSYSADISSSGRYITFYSAASNLVPGDTNGFTDIFVRDRVTNQTSRVSESSDGTQGNGSSYSPSISADGRIITFLSGSSNLVPGDTNDTTDIFVHDRQTSKTSRVSLASGGTQGNADSNVPAISGDGRYITFHSDASNLVPGDTNGDRDIFVHDRQTSQTSRVSLASDGTQGNDGSSFPAISGDGRYVTFHSSASNLVPGDTNDENDIFVHDRDTGQTSRVSVRSNGTQGNDYSERPAISGDGRFVAFESYASNLVPGDTNGYRDIFVHDRGTGNWMSYLPLVTR